MNKINADEWIISMLKGTSTEQLNRLAKMFRRDKRKAFLTGNKAQAHSSLFMEHAIVRILRDRQTSATP